MKKWKLSASILAFVLFLSSTIALLAGGGFLASPKNNLENNEVSIETSADSNQRVITLNPNGGTLSSNFVAKMSDISVAHTFNLVSSGTNSGYYVNECENDAGPFYALAKFTWIANPGSELSIEVLTDGLSTGDYIEFSILNTMLSPSTSIDSSSMLNTSFSSKAGTQYVKYTNTTTASQVYIYVKFIATYPYRGSGSALFKPLPITSKVVTNGQTYGTLPTPTRTGYTFDGWYTTSSGGTKITSTSTVATTVSTLYAHWSINDHGFEVKGLLDGVASNSVASYATFDVYKNSSLQAAGVSSFSEYFLYNDSYEVRNIQCEYDKEFLGITSDSAQLSGTITAKTTIILSFRTKTWNDYAATSFDSGSGTITDPYIIKTAQQLAYLSVLGQTQAITGNYKLAADIDLSGHEWCPIGVGQTYRLQGSFDGDFYSISNMTIEIFEYQLSYAGLFATVYSTGIVKNLIMKNAVVNKGVKVGVISGLNDNGGTITNCVVEDSIVNSSLYGGGICGWLWTAHVYNCLVKNTTITASSAGGIFGYQGGSGNCTLTNNGAYGLTITSGGATGALYGGTKYNVLTLNGSYAQGIVNNANSKLMYGDSTAWSNWTFNPMLNSGYPVQTTLFHIGGFSGSAYVYNYLRNTLGFTVA